MEEETRTTEQPRAGWRFRLGVIVFVVGFLSPLLVPLVAATGLPGAWKATISGLLMVGIPEVFTLVAIAIMGKPGFNTLKGFIFGLLKKYGPPETVSRTRYRVGLVMFLMPLLFGWLAPYGPHLIPGYSGHPLWVNVIGDLMLVSSLFVLGGEFWDKVRALFIHDARAQIPGR